MSEGTETGEDEILDEGEEAGDEAAEKGPPEDIESDPAYNPDDENLKGIKGG